MDELEKYYEVTKDGVAPIMVNPEELRKDSEWLISHCHKGKLIFENYSRAQLCFFEKQKQNSWRTHVPTQEVIRKFGGLIKGKGSLSGLTFAKFILASNMDCPEYRENCASTAASEIHEIEIFPDGKMRVAEFFH